MPGTEHQRHDHMAQSGDTAGMHRIFLFIQAFGYCIEWDACQAKYQFPPSQQFSRYTFVPDRPVSDYSLLWAVGEQNKQNGSTYLLIRREIQSEEAVPVFLVRLSTSL
jgi:hypothetical protein